MNKITVAAAAIALSALLGTGAAMAEGLSRAEVLAELVRARAAGELTAQQSEGYGFSGFALQVLTARSGLSRDTVKAELQRARQSGELARRDAESYGPVLPGPVAATGSGTALLAGQQPAAAR